MPLLELTDVFARYGPIRALHGVSLKVDEGEVVALLGELERVASAAHRRQHGLDPLTDGGAAVGALQPRRRECRCQFADVRRSALAIR